jgi:ATP-binding cassette subfamily G (WHITE) protein 2 (SNQ2)
MKAYFRAIAAWFSDPTPAQSAAGVTLLALTLYTGYNSEAYMIGALRWITYINVCIDYHVHYVVRLKFFFFFQLLKDAYKLIMTNEFNILDLECSNLVPQGPATRTSRWKFRFAPLLAVFLDKQWSMVFDTLSSAQLQL